VVLRLADRLRSHGRRHGGGSRISTVVAEPSSSAVVRSRLRQKERAPQLTQESRSKSASELRARLCARRIGPYSVAGHRPHANHATRNGARHPMEAGARAPCDGLAEQRVDPSCIRRLRFECR
jgi:hypothetical protein